MYQNCEWNCSFEDDYKSFYSRFYYTGLQNDQNDSNIAPMYSYVFGVAEFESEVRIGPSGHNFFLTSKTCFASFIFFQAQFYSKSSKKIDRIVFNCHKRPWIFSEFLES